MKKRNKKEKEKLFKKVLPILVLVLTLISACQPVPTQEVTETIISEPGTDDTLEPTEPPVEDPPKHLCLTRAHKRLFLSRGSIWNQSPLV